MSLCIAGMGWVTPLGSGVSEVWDRLLRGEEASAEKCSDHVGQKAYTLFRVPEAALRNLGAHPRLRRASAISRFAAAAGLAALKDAGLRMDVDNSKRIAIVLAVANGGVIYTKRFFHDIVSAGADAASPLLFPETVFNAAASHLAAIIGTTGRSYTLVGDGAVGLLAFRMAEDLMADDELDYCLVVGAEEADWILCDAYRKWRLLRSTPPIQPFHKPAKGTILSEGAGAILLGRSGAIKIEATHPGRYYSSQGTVKEAIQQVLNELAVPETGLAVVSANGTFIDEAEALAMAELLPKALIYTAKPALGESVGAAGLWQVIVAAQVLRSGQVPPGLHNPSPDARKQNGEVNSGESNRAVVLGCGLNQQVAGLRISIRAC